jgi:hypothetical protein
MATPLWVCYPKPGCAAKPNRPGVVERRAEALPRFVVLAHDWPTPHWDLLLEAGPVLKAWRLLAEPGVGRVVAAEPNSDHRLLYLDYEGPLSGGRGSVRRWDAGTFEGEVGGAGWRVRFVGRRLVGVGEMRGYGVRWVFGVLSRGGSAQSRVQS